jgi:hypothetical protein
MPLYEGISQYFKEGLNLTKHQFNGAINKAIDDLPDHYLQEMNDLTANILANVLYDRKEMKERNPNIALGAVQKALGLIIAKFFVMDQVKQITEGVCKNLKFNTKLWSQDE